MPKFILIDHSLCGVGGHHFEYAMHVLREAEAAGYEIVMGTNRQFREFSQVPDSWQVLPVFQYRTYTKYAVICSLNSKRVRKQRTPLAMSAMDAAPGVTWHPASWLARVREIKRRSRCRQRIRSFATACTRMFSRIDTRPGDIVMIPTLSELDLSGLTEYMSENPESKNLTWHLQFHFDFMGGREQPMETKLGRCAEMARRFKSDLSRIPDQRVVMHCTTEGLAAQYERLGVAKFRELPYPIDPRFHQPDHQPSPGDRLKITFAGGLRNEKGHSGLASAIEKIRKPVLDAGRAQIQIQAHERQFNKLITDIGYPSSSPALQNGTDVIQRIDHPLDGERYIDMIHRTDIGVFLYDGNSYASRCSGILAEMLAAGTPVIVPAGCWLADQLAEPNFKHLDRLFAAMPRGNIIQCTDPAPGVQVAGDGQNRIVVPQGSSACIFRFQYLTTPEPGAFLKLETRQFDQHGQSLGSFTSIVGQRRNGSTNSAMIPLREGVRQVEFRWQNAYQPVQVDIGRIGVGCITDGAVVPWGVVGLTVASNDQFPLLLKEMLDHYPHYLQSARTYSREWISKHLPSNTFATLMSRNVDTANGKCIARAA